MTHVRSADPRTQAGHGTDETLSSKGGMVIRASAEPIGSAAGRFSSSHDIAHPPAPPAAKPLGSALARLPQSLRSRRAGFTLIELLVVIGIIVILIGILIPAAAAVRKKAYATSTSQEISTIASACQAYYQDYHSYPGPISNNDLDGASAATAGTPTAIVGPGLVNTNTGAAPATVIHITSSENLVLGLTGGLNLTFASGAATAFNYTPSIIANASGPQSLNTLINTQKQTFAYFSPRPEELPTTDTNGNYPAFGAADSQIPEYLDHIPGNVISSTGSVANLPPFNYGPILYLRARVGATLPLYQGTGYSTGYQYNYAQVNLPYGFTTGTPTTYFANSALTGQPIGKDAFILISAGLDRTSGTSDDIIYGN